MSTTTFNRTPRIGEPLDYYPSPSDRVAAICIEVHPAELGDRPKVNLHVFHPDGETEIKLNVLPVSNSDVSNDDGFTPILQGRWGFAHEFAILQKDLSDSPLGSQSNEHVGTLDNSF